MLLHQGQAQGAAELELFKQQSPEHAPEGFPDGIERPEILLDQGAGAGVAELKYELE